MCLFSKIKFLLVLYPIMAFLACGSVTGSEDGTVSVNSRSAQSLRLAQTDTPDSPVVISAAIDNRESLVVINASPSSDQIAAVLYRSSTGEVARINVDAEGRPVTVETETAIASFSNYTAQTVDVAITVEGSVVSVETVLLEEEVVGLLDEDSLAPLARVSLEDSILRRILRSAVVAVRTFGCVGARVDRAKVDSQFLSLSNASCSSKLVETISATVKEDAILTDKVIEDLPDPGLCDIAGSFAQAEDCANEVGGELITEVLEENPSIVSVVEDTVESDAELAGEDPLFDPTIPGKPDFPIKEDPILGDPILDPTMPEDPLDPIDFPDPPDPDDPVPDNPNI